MSWKKTITTMRQSEIFWGQRFVIYCLISWTILADILSCHVHSDFDIVVHCGRGWPGVERRPHRSDLEIRSDDDGDQSTEDEKKKPFSGRLS